MSNDKQQTAVEWLSNRAYELFEQYSEGKFDRITLNKLMLEATEQAKEMEKGQMIDFADNFWFHCVNKDGSMKITPEQYYNKTYGGNDERQTH
jgi:hypothetical protein